MTIHKIPFFITLALAVFFMHTSSSCNKKVVPITMDTVIYEAILPGAGSWCIATDVPADIGTDTTLGNNLVSQMGQCYVTTPTYEAGYTYFKESQQNVYFYISVSGTPDSVVTANIYLKGKLVSTASGRSSASTYYVLR